MHSECGRFYFSSEVDVVVAIIWNAFYYAWCSIPHLHRKILFLDKIIFNVFYALFRYFSHYISFFHFFSFHFLFLHLCVLHFFPFAVSHFSFGFSSLSFLPSSCPFYFLFPHSFLRNAFVSVCETCSNPISIMYSSAKIFFLLNIY